MTLNIQRKNSKNKFQAVYWIWWICQIQGRILIWIWFEIQLQIHTFSYLSLTLSYLSFKNKVDLDGFQIKSKSNPNQYTPPEFGKSAKSNALIISEKVFFFKNRTLFLNMIPF